MCIYSNSAGVHGGNGYQLARRRRGDTGRGRGRRRVLTTRTRCSAGDVSRSVRAFNIQYSSAARRRHCRQAASDSDCIRFRQIHGAGGASRSVPYPCSHPRAAHRTPHAVASTRVQTTSGPDPHLCSAAQRPLPHRGARHACTRQIPMAPPRQRQSTGTGAHWTPRGRPWSRTAYLGPMCTRSAWRGT